MVAQYGTGKANLRHAKLGMPVNARGVRAGLFASRNPDESVKKQKALSDPGSDRAYIVEEQPQRYATTAILQ